MRVLLDFCSVLPLSLQIMGLLSVGNSRRTCEPTAVNKTSSRSHAVLQVVVEGRGRVMDLSQEVCTGRLFMVDLAGSERAAQTQVGLADQTSQMLLHTVTGSCNTVTDSCNTGTDSCNTVTDSCNTVTDSCNTVTDSCNTVTDSCTQ